MRKNPRGFLSLSAVLAIIAVIAIAGGAGWYWVENDSGLLITPMSPSATSFGTSKQSPVSKVIDNAKAKSASDVNQKTVSYTKSDGSGWSISSEGVYWSGRQVDGADLSSFEVIKGPEYYNQFAKDKYHVYFHGYFLMSVNFVGHTSNILSGVDPTTFTVLYVDEYGSYFYSKDKNRIYYTFNGDQSFSTDVLEGADPTTFVPVSDPSGKIDAKDSNRTYFKGKIVD